MRETLRRLRAKRQIVFRYCTEDGRLTKDANPNGSLDNIAGVVNEAGTVLGLMPHPERAAESALGGTDGVLIFHSLLGSLVEDGSFSSASAKWPMQPSEHGGGGVTAGEPKVTLDLALAHGLTSEEYDRIIRRLGREPTFTELGLFSSLWSEHCAYKHSRVFLRGAADARRARAAGARARTRGSWIWATNSRSPSRSRATTTRRSSSRSRARRPASAASCATSSRWARAPSRSSTRFASAIPRMPGRDDSSRAWSRASAGTATASACPNLGGEVGFAPEYAGNPLVNAMAVGLVNASDIFRARAEGAGNPVFYVGRQDGARRHPRRHHGLRHLRRGRRGAASDGAGGRSVHREAPPRGVPRGDGDRRRRRHPGHGRGRSRLRVLGDAGARRAPAWRSSSRACPSARRG